MKNRVTTLEKIMNDRDVNTRNDLSKRDAELAQRIARTLDESTSVAAFDADTRTQLAMARHRALTRTRKQRFAAVALAASILALAATPWMLRQPASKNTTDDVAYLSVDPEMLADMDMLEAIGEAQ